MLRRRLNAELGRRRAQVVSCADQLLAEACGGFGPMGGCLGVLLQHLGVLLYGTGKTDLFLSELGDTGVQLVDLPTATAMDSSMRVASTERSMLCWALSPLAVITLSTPLVLFCRRWMIC